MGDNFLTLLRVSLIFVIQSISKGVDDSYEQKND